MKRSIRIAFSFAKNNSAVSSIEFALIVPVCILLLLAGIDLARYIIFGSKCTAVANSIGEMIAVTPSNSNASTIGDGLINSSDIQTYYKSAAFTFPEMLSQNTQGGQYWQQILQINISSISFSVSPNACTTSCQYTPKLDWTFSSAAGTKFGGKDVIRQCGINFNKVSDVASYSSDSLPSSVFSTRSLIVVDVFYRFEPLFFLTPFLSGQIIERSIYFPPRFVPSIEASVDKSIFVCN